MAAHIVQDNISMIIQIVIVASELLGAIVAIVAVDSFIRWTSWGMVLLGLFINYTINRKKFHAALNEWLLDIKNRFSK